jgi:hypothetical protein
MIEALMQPSGKEAAILGGDGDGERNHGNDKDRPR